MRGSMLKEILQEQGISISELARRLNVSAQTLYSMVKRDNQKVDFDMMMHISSCSTFRSSGCARIMRCRKCRTCASGSLSANTGG